LQPKFAIAFLFYCVFAQQNLAQFNLNFEISGDKDFYTTPLYLDSTIYVNGFFRIGSTTSGSLLAKIDLNGDTIFVKKHIRDSTIFFGGFGKTLIHFNKRLYSVGVYSKTSPTVNIAYIEKFNLNGDSLGYYELTAPFGVVFNGISITKDSNLIITGYVRPTISNYDVLLLKIDTLLTPVWTQTYGGLNEDVGWSIDTTYDGGYVIGGLTQSYGSGLRDAYLVKVDSLGVFEWQKTYGGTYYDGGKVITTGINEVTLYGVLNVSSSSTYSRLFFRRYTLNGTLLGENLSVIYKEYINPVECIKNGNNLYFNVYCNIDTTFGNIPVANIIKTDLGGNIIFDKYYLISQNSNYTTGMIQLSDKSLVSAGYLYSDGTTVLTEDAWMFRVDSMGCFISGCTIGIDDLAKINEDLMIYPNPTEDKFRIKLPDFNTESRILILNSVGEIVFSLNSNNQHEIEIDFEKNPRGIYLIAIYQKGFFFSQKIILK